ncbi:MAG: hypothetical protein LUH82_02080 [Clostridiales bacterium]|nr:hypothetical protein [Clostridiales bacterium]
MGGSKKYLKYGGFTEKTFRQEGLTANDIKITVRKSDGMPSTPLYSNAPYTMYAKVDNDNGLVSQVAVYGKGEDHRAKLKDIDIGHTHKNITGNLKFDKKDIHIHEYDKNAVRSKIARKPSKKERRLLMIARYGKRKS